MTLRMPSVLAPVARGLDAVRAPTLRFAMAHSMVLREAAGSRRARLEVLAWAALLVPLALALTAPTWLFVWGPLLLGLPHVLADVRYLILPRYAPVAIGMRDAAVAALLLASLWSSAPSVGGLAVVAAIALAPGTPIWPRVIGVMLAGAIYLAAVAAPITASYLLLHGHNVVAIGLAGLVMVGGRAGRTLVAGALAISLAILLGAADPMIALLPIDDISGYLLPEAAFVAWGPSFCARVALLFVVLQSVHYAAWLRLVPDARRPRAGMRTFAGSVRALEADVSRLVVFALAVGMVALLLAAANDAAEARQTYLRFAGFHAYLELAVLGRYLVARCQLPTSPS